MVFYNEKRPHYQNNYKTPIKIGRILFFHKIIFQTTWFKNKLFYNLISNFSIITKFCLNLNR